MFLRRGCAIDPTHVCVTLLLVAPNAFSEEQMVDIDSFRSFLVLPLASLILILVLVPVGKLLRRTGHNPVGAYSRSFLC
jgi:hypothetical protein